MSSSNILSLPPLSARGAPAMEAEPTFREAIRQLACGVCLVTFGAGEEHTGLTATSVSPLSIEPPTLLVCLSRDSPDCLALTRLGAFVVNVLAADQREYALQFRGPSSARVEERGERGRWAPSPSGAWRLADSIGAFDCEIEECIERHTHAIIIGRVRRVLIGEGSGALVYWRGSYDQVGWSRDEISRAVGLKPVGAQTADRSRGQNKAHGKHGF